LLQAGSTLILGIVLAFFFSWKMTLISIVVIPTVLIGVIFEGKSMAQSAVAEKLALENATKIATEAISNIRTVASLGN
jgi:ATP-binding cassette, subfamily B (MDR/TAP), member 1